MNAPPDGYTLLLVNAGNAINATLYEKLKFNLIRDIAPVAGLIIRALLTPMMAASRMAVGAPSCATGFIAARTASICELIMSVVLRTAST